MKILVTGGLGNVGKSTILEAIKQGHSVKAFASCKYSSKRNARIFSRHCAKFGKAPEFIFGDIRNKSDLLPAVKDCQVIIHLAAIIPPMAEKNHELTQSVNVNGTASLLAACKSLDYTPRIVLTSSISVYGDRLQNYWISLQDPLIPSPGDVYAQTKIDAEDLVRKSGLPFCILRLTSIMSAEKLSLDPLAFHMPLATKLEICHTEDAGRACIQAACLETALGKTLNIGGGQSCRIEFSALIDRLFHIMGLGSVNRLPKKAFATSGFHCGWFTDSDYSESLLHFQRKSLNDFYSEVAAKTRFVRPFSVCLRPLILKWMLSLSPFWTKKNMAHT